MKKLPIGIRNFREIREEGYCYVDKTSFVKQLTDGGKYYFLSRPRRFGKSLFLDTLKEAFSGNKKLFKGLFLEKNWDWKKQYPVPHFSFGSGVRKSSEDLRQVIEEKIAEHAQIIKIRIKSKSISGSFLELIRTLHNKNGPVVILIDEYDKPILDNITDPKKAQEMREGLKDFYSVIKDADPFLKFVLLTGVSKFSKGSIFSGLNNLTDISLDKRYASICGYTDAELQSTFADRLENVDLSEVRRWYNGYNFLGDKVSNPFDILQYLDKGEFRNYWFETGTPTFLVNLMRERHFHLPEGENLPASEAILSSFDIDRIELPALLFQTGYLTIKHIHPGPGLRSFILSFPNLEVKASLTDFLLTYLTNDPTKNLENKNLLQEHLLQADFAGIESVFSAFFASIPHDWYRKNQLAKYEGYYASIVYCYFAALGFDVIAEDVTNQGRIDLTVKLADKVFIFEFKVIDIDRSKIKPLAQIKTKGYEAKYRCEGRQVFLIGIEFTSKTRNIKSFAWETKAKNVPYKTTTESQP